MDGIELSDQQETIIFIKISSKRYTLHMNKQDTIQDVYDRVHDLYPGKFILVYLGKPINKSLKVATFHKTMLVLVKERSIFAIQRGRTSQKRTKATSHMKTLTRSKWFTSRREKAIQYETMLKDVCKVSGQCLALGRYTPEITAFFQYESFAYSKDPPRMIASGASGIVYVVDYERNKYTSSAILKSSSQKAGDNLTYEYVVGSQYINRVNLHFPCFISTYGLYYGNESNIQQLKLQRKVNYNTACMRNAQTSILIQDIHGAVELIDLVGNQDFVQDDLLPILYIIYHALSALSTQFTHYDLSPSNVIVLKLPEPIEYDYGDIRIRSHYLPKIIDYGRSFFDNGSLNSRKIYHDVCSAKKCNPRCGDFYGFTLLHPTPWHFISSQKNESHDLKLLYMLSQESKHPWSVVDKLLAKVVYGVGEEPRTSHYGTPENLSSISGKIHNVHDALQCIEDVLPPSVYQTISGRLIIRPGIPMVFETIESK